MTTEQQKTFGEVVGMEPIVPTRLHPDDLVDCEDRVRIPYCHVHTDCRGRFWSDPNLRDEADVTIVEEVLTGVDEWVTEYCTENTDYADGYAHIVDELSHDWKSRVEEWVEYDNSDYADIIEDAYNAGELDFDLSDGEGGEYDSDEYIRNVLCKPHADRVAQWVYEALKGSFDSEPEYSRNEYSAYDGPGCCLASFDIGEYEEQLEVSAFPEFKELHDEGRLRDILNRTNCDAYVRLSDWSLRGDHPCFETYHSPGGQWHWVVSGERMEDLVREAIVDLVGCAD